MWRHQALAIGLASFVFILAGCNTSQPVRGTGIISIDGPQNLEMWASSGCVAAGDTVKLRATLTNNSPKAQVFDVPDQPVLDIWILIPIGTVRWSDGQPLTPALTHLELQPGQSKSIEMDWSTKGLRYGGPIGVEVRFIDSPRAPKPTMAGVTVQVAGCVGPFGP